MTIFKLITDGFHLETASDTNGISHSQGNLLLSTSTGLSADITSAKMPTAMKILIRDAEALSSKIAS